MNKNLVGWVVKGIILPRYIGVIINHYKNPYEPTSIMENNKGIFAWLTSGLKTEDPEDDFPLPGCECDVFFVVWKY